MRDYHTNEQVQAIQTGLNGIPNGNNNLQYYDPQGTIMSNQQPSSWMQGPPGIVNNQIPFANAMLANQNYILGGQEILNSQFNLIKAEFRKAHKKEIDSEIAINKRGNLLFIKRYNDGSNNAMWLTNEDLELDNINLISFQNVKDRFYMIGNKEGPFNWKRSPVKTVMLI